MLFVDEDIRHEFYQRPTLLQIVCQLLESQLFNHHYHLSVFNVQDHGDITVAMVAVEAITPETKINQTAIKFIVAQLEKQFKRRDNRPTIQFDHDDPTILRVLVSGSGDLAAPL